MGADYRAYTVVGVSLPAVDELPRLTAKRRKKAFEHDYPDDGETEFDPKTGKPLWLDETEEYTVRGTPAVVYEDEYGETEVEEGQILLKAPEGMRFHYGTDGEPVFLGVVSRTGNSNGGDDTAFLAPQDMNSLRFALRGALKPIGLWEEDDFGIYTNLYCSY